MYPLFSIALIVVFEGGRFAITLFLYRCSNNLHTTYDAPKGGKFDMILTTIEKYHTPTVFGYKLRRSNFKSNSCHIIMS